jgi:hydroxymethylbilane synthase
MKSIFKLGTRKSLLAWAQSSWVAREVEKNNPDVTVELVGIETRGDVILDVPLRKVEGKEFFVAELDLALRSRNVDFTVHSLKDLSLERPADFYCGVIPKRENPRDVILFGPHILEHLQQGKTIRVGTSSPRRIENIPSFLDSALPKVGMAREKSPKIEFIEIRGNVNTRLGRVHESQGSDRYLDGVVLAFAGLIRLWADSAGRAELSRLLQGVRWMVLPLRECPAAPGQGALAVECRSEDVQVRKLLEKIHSPETAIEVTSERQLLADSGGGCHQRFGATSISHPELGRLLYVRGKSTQGKELNEMEWKTPVFSPASLGLCEFKLWDGSEWKAQVSETREPISEAVARSLNEANAVFLAHSRALPESPEVLECLRQKRIWTSGTESWFRLASKGLWVEGCAESLGFDPIFEQLQEPVLGLPCFQNWMILTHLDAVEGWKNYRCQVVPTYRINGNYGNEAKSALQGATYVFWSSGSQFLELKESINSNAVHACGPGKTVACLRENGVSPLVFPNSEEWRKWVSQQIKGTRSI